MILDAYLKVCPKNRLIDVLSCVYDCNWGGGPGTQKYLYEVKFSKRYLKSGYFWVLLGTCQVTFFSRKGSYKTSPGIQKNDI